MDVKPDHYNFRFMEKTGFDILSITKEITARKNLWLGINGITRKGGNMWTSMRGIMQSHRTYS